MPAAYASKGGTVEVKMFHKGQLWPVLLVPTLSRSMTVAASVSRMAKLHSIINLCMPNKGQ